MDRRASRFAVIGLIALFVLSGGAPGAAAATCWPPPVPGAVTDPFSAPACPWCAGNRGLEYATTPGEPVRAVAAGEVTFAGDVAGDVYVAVDIGAGQLVTYGRLGVRRVDVGQRVRAGQVVGRAGDGTLIVTVRRDGGYVDPAPLIGRLVGRARLVPTDGSASRPAPPARLACPG